MESSNTLIFKSPKYVSNCDFNTSGLLSKQNTVPFRPKTTKKYKRLYKLSVDKSINVNSDVPNR